MSATNQPDYEYHICQICEFEFLCPDLKREHEAEEHGIIIQEDPRYKLSCSNCNKNFIYRSYMENHINLAICRNFHAFKKRMDRYERQKRGELVVSEDEEPANKRIEPVSMDTSASSTTSSSKFNRKKPIKKIDAIEADTAEEDCETIMEREVDMDLSGVQTDGNEEEEMEEEREEDTSDNDNYEDNSSFKQAHLPQILKRKSTQNTQFKVLSKRPKIKKIKIKVVNEVMSIDEIKKLNACNISPTNSVRSSSSSTNSNNCSTSSRESPTPVSCEFCHLTFPSEMNLSLHKASIHVSEYLAEAGKNGKHSTYVCFICHQIVRGGAFEFKKHNFRHHGLAELYTFKVRDEENGNKLVKEIKIKKFNLSFNDQDTLDEVRCFLCFEQIYMSSNNKKLLSSEISNICQHFLNYHSFTVDHHKLFICKETGCNYSNKLKDNVYNHLKEKYRHKENK